MSEPKTAVLYLIDALNWTHRALNGPDDDFVATLRGMLKAFFRRASPRYLASVWGADRPTFRHDLLDSYKSKRSPDLDERLPTARRVFQELGIPCVDPVLDVEATT